MQQEQFENQAFGNTNLIEAQKKIEAQARRRASSQFRAAEEIEIREVQQAALESNPNDFSASELMQPSRPDYKSNVANDTRVSQIGLLQSQSQDIVANMPLAPKKGKKKKKKKNNRDVNDENGVKNLLETPSATVQRPKA